MIDWEKEFDKLPPRCMECGQKDDDEVKTFIKLVLHEKEVARFKQASKLKAIYFEKDRALKIDEKKLDDILREFYEHMCGVDDYGCEICIECKQKILDLQGEIK